MKKVVKAYGNHSYAHGKRKGISNKNWLIIGVVAAVSAFIAFAAAPGFALLLVLFVLAAGMGYLKRYIQSAPVDLDILFFGGGYLAAFHSVWLGLFFAVAGTILSEVMAGGLRELSWVKIAAVLVTTMAAAVFAEGPGTLFIAVILGLLVQYVLMLALMGDAVMNFLRRLTNAAFNAYIIFFLLPIFS